MNYICLDGQILPADQPVLMANNRGFRYGDAIFETIRVSNSVIPLFDYHIDRLFSGLKTLGYQLPPGMQAKHLLEQILSICDKNGCREHARVRLTAFRGNGGLNDIDDQLHYLVEASLLNPANRILDEEGLNMGIYQQASKNCDEFASLKSANFLPYLMAARYAKQNGWNEAAVLNIHGRVADATIANIFLIKNKRIFTPSLSEGPVGGVMRKWLLQNLPASAYAIEEKTITLSELYDADEIFLTNAVSGIRWVRSIGERIYSTTSTKEIYQFLVKTIWA